MMQEHLKNQNKNKQTKTQCRGMRQAPVRGLAHILEMEPRTHFQNFFSDKGENLAETANFTF